MSRTFSLGFCKEITEQIPYRKFSIRCFVVEYHPRVEVKIFSPYYFASPNVKRIVSRKPSNIRTNNQISISNSPKLMHKVWCRSLETFIHRLLSRRTISTCGDELLNPVYGFPSRIISNWLITRGAATLARRQRSLWSRRGKKPCGLTFHFRCSLFLSTGHIIAAGAETRTGCLALGTFLTLKTCQDEKLDEKGKSGRDGKRRAEEVATGKRKMRNNRRDLGTVGDNDEWQTTVNQGRWVEFLGRRSLLLRVVGRIKRRKYFHWDTAESVKWLTLMLDIRYHPREWYSSGYLLIFTLGKIFIGANHLWSLTLINVLITGTRGWLNF